MGTFKEKAPSPCLIVYKFLQLSIIFEYKPWKTHRPKISFTEPFPSTSHGIITNPNVRTTDPGVGPSPGPSLLPNKYASLTFPKNLIKKGLR